jgi:single-strand DNA-binding protein
MLNSVNLIGRLTRDPEHKQTNSGKSVCEFSIAVGKRIKPQDGSPDADFFRVVAWAAQADFAAQYLTKGRLVSVGGRLHSRRYTASDGQQREVVEVVADSIQALDKARSEEDAA